MRKLLFVVIAVALLCAAGSRVAAAPVAQSVTYAGGGAFQIPDVAEYMPISENASSGTILVIGDGEKTTGYFDRNDTRVADIGSPALGIANISVTYRYIKPKNIGVFTNGQWYMDVNRNGIWEGQPPDQTTSFGFPGDTPIFSSFWLYEGSMGQPSMIAVFRGGQWYLDANQNYVWDGTGTGKDLILSFGFPGAIPVTGDWNNIHWQSIGVYNAGTWYLDRHGNFVWEGTGTGKDVMYSFGFPGAIPVVGDWNRDSWDEIGVYTDGIWYVDANHNYVWDGTGTGKDAIFSFGFPGAIPVIGDWNGDEYLEIGVYNAGTWYLDTDPDNHWDDVTFKDMVCQFGAPGFTPVAGNYYPKSLSFLL